MNLQTSLETKSILMSHKNSCRSDNAHTIGLDAAVQLGTVKLYTGSVTLASKTSFQVRLCGEVHDRPASIAAGLLLLPNQGDTVLLGCDQSSGCWIVSVLARRALLPAQITVAGATEVTIAASTLTLHTESALRIRSAELDVRSDSVSAHLGVLRLTVRVLQAAAGKLQVWANLLQARVSSLAVRAEQRVTKIDQADLLQAGQLLVDGEELVQLRARQIQVQAKQNVMVDGKQILMG